MNHYIAPEYFQTQDYGHLFGYVHTHGYTDLHLQTAYPILAMKNGQLEKLSARHLSNYEVEGIIKHLYGSNAGAILLGGNDLDFSYVMPQNKTIRFRVNATACHYLNETGIQVSMRIMPLHPPTLESLDVPAHLHNLSAHSHGIVMVCGTTGSGKSTLLASMLQHRLLHSLTGEKIITLEAPIEYLFPQNDSGTSMVSQTEIPRHLRGFAYAVRNSLRRMPSAIMVGEARDQETMSSVIEAALTGHSVFTTLHSASVVEALNRMIMMFPDCQRDLARYDLLCSLRAIIWQRLIPSKQGGRVAWREVVIFNEKTCHDLQHLSWEKWSGYLKQLIYEQNGSKKQNLDYLYTHAKISEQNYHKYIIEIQ